MRSARVLYGPVRAATVGAPDFLALVAPSHIGAKDVVQQTLLTSAMGVRNVVRPWEPSPRPIVLAPRLSESVVKVARAENQAEAAFLENWLYDQGVPSVLREADWTARRRRRERAGWPPVG
jgi:hypothetical protein